MSAPRERLFTAPFFAMCGYSFTVFFSLFQLLPTAPFHVHALGGSRLQSGLFLGLLTYSSAFSAPLTGALADRLGRTRQLLVCSLAIAGFSMLYAIAPSVILLLILVPIHGIVWSGLLSASGAYMTSILPPGRRVEGIAYWGMSSVMALANRVLHFGGVGAGTAYKLAINLIGSVQIASAAEGLALAERAGLDPKLVVEAIATSQAASPQVVRNTQRMIAGDFARDIVFTPVLRLKDVDYALRLADSLGVATPFGDAAREAFARLVALGARDDHEARVIEVARKRKGE